MKRISNVILIVYLAAFITIFTYFVPFNICFSYVNADNSPHTLITQTEFHSVIYNYYLPSNSQTTASFKKSIIDYKRLFTEIFLITTICGIPYFIVIKSRKP
jgi:hypothetical protein